MSDTPVVIEPPKDSILNSTKKVLGIEAEYDVFDVDILMHINTVFGTLNQLGVGPEDGFEIEDASTGWSEYLGGDKRLNPVKTYMVQRVRLEFDPPTTSFAIEAIKNRVQELEWRLNVVVDNVISQELVTNQTVYLLNDSEPFPEDATSGSVGFDPVSGNIWRKL